ncbi:hypothetical protein [Natrinema pallidum]|uniref:Uncharacterized protein n=1 Tax=Natrinema pallidum TaxID=69527 RepID=A0A4P9TKP9_9EURY|nr:hypothetical protein [Natrinema pallidum]QCW04560.1 hypothetical protein FGF80_15560 [Natrinema pallidum]
MGRRRFIETLAALGLSSQAVQGMTQERLQKLTGDPTDEVPMVHSLRAENPKRYKEPPFPNEPVEREVKYYTVSRDRWVRMKSAYDAANRARRKIDRELDRPERIKTGVGLTTRGQSTKYTVRVTVDQSGDPNRHSVLSSSVDAVEQLKGVLPDTLYGQPDGNSESAVVEASQVQDASRFAVEEVPVEYAVGNSSPEDDCKSHNDCCDFYERQYRIESATTRIPSGTYMSVERSGSWNGVSTLGARVYSKQHNSFGFVSTAHSAYDEDDDDPNAGLGRKVAQPHNEPIGTVRSIRNYQRQDSVGYPEDMMYIELDNDEYYPFSKLAEQGTNGADRQYKLGSILGRDRLRDFEADKEFIQQGARTGRCRRELYEVNEDSDGDEIVLSRPNEDGGGNSGGPYLIEDDDSDDLLIAGIHQHGDTRTHELPGLPHPPHPQSARANGSKPEINVGEGIYIGDIEDKLNVQVT